MTRPPSPDLLRAGADGVGLIASVRRFRARARRMVLVNESSTAIAIGAAVAVVWNLAWASTSEDRWTAFALSLVSALAAAAALTHLRTPTLSATGAAIDRRLHLQDRIVAALENCREQDPVAILVVRDAVARLRGAKPAEVFPLEFGRRAAAGTLLLGVALLTATADLRPVDPSRETGAGAGAMAVIRPEGRTAAPEDVSGTPAAVTDSEVGPAETTNARLSGAPAQDGPPPAAAASATDGAPVAPEESESRLAPLMGAPTEPQPRSRVTGTNASSSTELPPEKGGDGTRPRGQSTASGQSRAALGAMPGGAGASRPGAGQSTGGDSGGVAAGTLSASGGIAHSRSSRPASAPLPASALTRGQADGAMSRDDIPPALRRFVRDYFLRLQSTGSPR